MLLSFWLVLVVRAVVTAATVALTAIAALPIVAVLPLLILVLMRLILVHILSFIKTSVSPPPINVPPTIPPNLCMYIYIPSSRTEPEKPLFALFRNSSTKRDQTPATRHTAPTNTTTTTDDYPSTKVYITNPLSCSSRRHLRFVFL